MISTETLRRYACFRGAAEETLRELAMASDVVRFESGDALFDDGEPAAHLFVLTRGEVDVQYHLNSGEHRTVDTLVEGDIIVWSAVLEPHRTTAHGVARQQVEALAIDAPKLRRLCEADTGLGYTMMKSIAEVVRQRLHGARVQLATTR